MGPNVLHSSGRNGKRRGKAVVILPSQGRCIPRGNLPHFLGAWGHGVSVQSGTPVFLRAPAQPCLCKAGLVSGTGLGH